MFAALLPLFDADMSVGAYSLFSQKENLYLDPRLFVTGKYDGAYVIDGLEVIEKVGMSTLSSDREIFVPVDNVSIFTDIDSQCKVKPSRIVILIDSSVRPEEMYIDRIKILKEQGYGLAMRKLSVSKAESYYPILELMDYLFLNFKKDDIAEARDYFSRRYPKLKLIAGNISSMDDYEELKNKGGYYLYEGDFYRMPVTKGENEVAPVKLNYIELLNIVNEEDFDLTDAADIIGRDTALVIDLLKIVNKLSRNSEIATIRHAAAMLGQRELRKWIITAVAKKLCLDKPNEITRLSLIRAKFAENLAKLFCMGVMEQELFLLGLFSVLDIILDKPMEEALQLVLVSKLIRDALVNDEGDFAPILDLIKNYESANWSEVSRVMVVNEFDTEDVYKAYCNALSWYRDMFFDE